MIETRYFDLQSVPADIKDVNLCLGFFDGIHIGHQKMIKSALNEGHKVAILTFDNPPTYILGTRVDKESLTSIDDKAEFLESMGVSYLLVMPFDETIKNMSWIDFINRIIKKINPLNIFCGDDYTFGKDAYGTPKMLNNFYPVHTTKVKNDNGIKVSSRKIREYISIGKIEEANNLLGRPYKICGLVVRGVQEGSKIGFPTANLHLDFPYIMPAIGVYIGYAYAHEKKYKALISVGTHPTFIELQRPIIEVHIIDFNDNLYGDYLYVEFICKIRDIVYFPSKEALVNQLKLDKKQALDSLSL